jgi:hypothetical protein
MEVEIIDFDTQLEWVRYQDGTKLRAFRGSLTVCETDIKED